MKRISILVLMLAASTTWGQSRIPATMVNGVAGVLVQLPTNVTLDAQMRYVDSNMTSVARVSPVITTNATPYAFTPSFSGVQIILYRSGGTNVQVWQSTGVTTQSWRMMYPVSAIISTNILTNGILPRCVGDELILNGASNLIYRSFNGTSWLRNTNAIYSAP